VPRLDAYDRSPCRPVPAQKLACLHAAGELEQCALAAGRRHRHRVEASFTIGKTQRGTSLPHHRKRVRDHQKLTFIFDDADPALLGIR
jgi:proline racemase